MSHKPLIMEAGQLKQSGVAEIDASAIEYLEDKEYPANTLPAKLNESRFTIIYPNGGTEEQPANVSSSKRYELDNPFLGHPVNCQAEILVNNKWGATGWGIKVVGSSSMTYGVTAYEYDGKIVVQVAASGVLISSLNSGNPYDTTLTFASAPCRVKVWRVD